MGAIAAYVLVLLLTAMYLPPVEALVGAFAGRWALWGCWCRTSHAACWALRAATIC